MRNIYSLLTGITLLVLWFPLQFDANDSSLYDLFHTEKAAAPSTQKPARKARVLLSKSPLRVKREGVAALLAPAITATKTYTLTNDTGLAGASAGDELEYTIVITNGGTTDATGVSFTDQLDPNTTLVNGSLQVSPIAQNDTYQTIGNVGLDIPAGSGVLTNDINPGSGSLLITTTSPITTTGNGKVTLNTATGAFTYEPAPGYTGTDTFTYTLGNGSGLTTTATVSIAVSGKIWFINNASTGSGGGEGTLANPFREMNTFSVANTGAAGKPGDNDYIFVYTGSGNYVTSATLRNGQKLIGQGASATLLAITGYTAPSGTNLLPPTGGSTPVLTTTAAGTHAVNLGSGNTLRGFTIANTTGSKINNTSTLSFGTLTVSEVTLTGSGQALNLTNGTLAATFTSITSNTSAAAGISLTNVAGNLTSTGGTTITNSAGQGISVSNTVNTGTFNFGTTSVTGSGSTGLASTGFANTLQFSSLTITPANGQKGIDISSGSGTLNVTTGSVAANGNSAISIAGTNAASRITLGTTFTSLSSINSSATGISLSNVQGDLTSTTTTITNPATQGLNVSTAVGSGTFNFGTTSITSSGGTGLASSGFANTLTFSSLTVTPDAGQKGIDITGANGTLNIAASPEITTTNNTALSIAGVSSGSRVTLGITLTKVSASGTAKGISLTNTAGSFAINGTGTTDGSAGTIQNMTARGAEFINATGITLKNMNFLSANTTDGCSAASAGISYSGCNGAVYLESVSNVVLDNININSTNGSDANGTNSQRGITGTGISGLTISNTVVKNTGNATEEGPIFLQNLSGTINLTSLNLTGSAGVDDLFRIENTSTTSTITIDGSNFSNTQTSVNGSYGLVVSNFGTGTTTIHVKNSAFNQIKTQGIKGIAEGTGTLNYNITNCTFDPQAGIGSAIDLVSNQSGILNFNILNNPTVKARGTSVINVVSQGTSNAQGRINNNTITHVGGAEDSGNGVRVHAEENSNLKVQINANTINGVPSEAGILARSRNGNGRLDVIITNNNITLPNPLNEIGHNIQVEAGTSGSTFTNPTCAYVANNANSGRSQFGSDFRVRTASATHVIYLQGSGASAANIWDNNNNSPKTTSGGTVSSSGTWGTTIQSGTCVAPSNPSVARMMADAEAAELEKNTAQRDLAEAPATPDTTQATPESAIAVTNPQVDSTTLAANQEGLVAQPASVVKENTPGIGTTQPTAREAATLAGETVTVNGSGTGFTLPAGKSVTIKFKVTINSSTPAGTCQVSNQGTVSGSNFSNVLTDDPGVTGAANLTVTPLKSAPAITAQQQNIVTDTDAGLCTASEAFAVQVAGCPAPSITYKIGNTAITSPHVFPLGTTTVDVTVSNGNTPDATTSFTVTVNPPPAPVIADAGQPANQIACTGANATFTVTVPGSGFSYQWQKKSGSGEFTAISATENPSAATATLTLTAVSIGETGTQYRCIVTNTCGSSTTSGTATLTVNPLPTATISGAATVCQGTTSPVVTFTGANGTAPYTFTYRINNGTIQTITTEGTNASVTVPQVTGTAGTFNYTLLTVKDASATECTQSQSGSATITVTPLPTATISGTATVCKDATNPAVTFTGATGTAPYTFTYTVNGEEKTITTSTGNSVTVSQATHTAGSFVYTLVSVKDASECSQPQSGTATITVTNPTEGGTVAGSAVVCKDANGGTLTLTGYTGSIVRWQRSTNNQDWQDISSTTASQPYTNLSQTTYYRAVVQSGSCGEVFSSTATLTIVPLTAATASGTTSVAQNAAQPTVTFSVSGGTAPYTFTYTLNNGAEQTLTTTGSATTATMQQPTTVVGAFAYTLVKVTDATGCSFTPATPQTATVTVSSNLTATISGTTAVCQQAAQPTVTFSASGGTAPYTFYYTLNGGAEQSVTTIGSATTATVQQPTTSSGSFVYTLTRLTGAGNASNTITGQSATITVDPTSVGGTVAGSAVVCQDANGGTLTLTGYTGSIVRWQRSTNNSTWTDLANTTASQPYTNLSQTTYYRAVVQSGNCGEVFSSTATLTIVPLTAATASGTTSVAQNAAQPTVTFSVSGGTAPYTFTYTLNNGAEQTLTTTGSATTATVQQPTTVVGAFAYTLVKVTDATGCSFTPATPQTATVTVSSNLTATISGTTAVCQQAAQPTVTFSASGGTAPYTFYYTLNGGAEQSVTTIGSATTATVQQPTTSPGSFVYILTRVTGAGNASNTIAGQLATITVDPASVGGTVAGSAVVCQDANGGTLTLTGYTGSILRWQRSTNNSTWTDLANTTTSQAYTNLSQTTYYRAVVQSGNCGEVFSSTATLTVDPAPVGGTATAAATIICYNGSTSISLTGYTGGIQWQRSTNNQDWTNIDGQTTATLSTGALSTTTYFRARLTSGVCNETFSSVATVTVDPASVGGTAVAATATICYNDSTSISLTGYTGNIQWQRSTNNQDWTNVDGQTTATLNTSALTTTTYFRARVVSGVCGETYSSVATVTVDPASVGGTVAGSAVVCKDANSGTLTLTGYTGSIVRWQRSTNNSTWTDLANTTASQSYTNLSQTTYYRAVVQSGSCGEVFSSTATLTIVPLTAATASGTTSVAQNAAQPTVTFSVSGGTAPYTFTYTLNNGAEQTLTTTGSATTATVQQPTTVVGAFAYTLVKVTDATGCSFTPATPQTATVTVSSNLTATISGTTAVCQQAAQPTVSFSASGGTAPYTFYYTLNGGAEQSVTTIGSATTATVQQPTTSPGSFVYTLTRVTGAGNASNTIAGQSATITVDPTSVGGTAVATTATICYNGSTSISLTGYTGGIQWQKSTNNQDWTNIDGQTTATLSTGALTTTTYFRARLTSGMCSEAFSLVATVTVDPASVGGTAVATTATICYNGSTSISLTGYTGNIQWQRSTNNQDWTNIDGQTTATLNTGALTSLTYFRARVVSGVCGEAFSSVATVTVDPAPVGGTATAAATIICYNEATSISLTGYTGNIQWQRSINNQDWTNIDGQTTATLNTGALSTTTYFRARLTSGVCNETFSSVATVTILTPAVPVAEGANIVFGGSTTLTATGCSGDGFVLKWYQASDDALVTMPVSPTVTTNYYARCEQTQGNVTCLSSKSNEVTLNVLNPVPPVAQDAAICPGGSVTLTATGCSGDGFVLKWYQASNDALVTMPVSPAATSRYYARCEQTLHSTTATSDKSNEVEVAVLMPQAPVAQAATIYLGQAITLTATGCSGSGYTLKWYQASDDALVTMPVTPTAATAYYARCEQTLHGTSCLSGKSNEVTLQVVKRIFVNAANQSAPVQDGNSWTSAYGNLQAGLAAATAGVEVWVAQGTYVPTESRTRSISFQVPNGVRLYGGFAGSEEALAERDVRAHATILSGEIGDLNSVGDNSYHVVLFSGTDPTTRLDGFTITRGNANMGDIRAVQPSNADQPVDLNTGGGIAMDGGAKPVIAHCTIIANHGAFGGGVSMINSSPTFQNCIIRGNQASYGGGVYNFYSAPQFTNVLFAGNYGPGGALYNSQSTPTLTQVTIAGNGGERAASLNTRGSHLTIRNSIIWGNQGQTLDQNATISHSIVEGGYAGTGNLNVDPRFVQPVAYDQAPTLAGDYRLQSSSAAINAGDNTVTSGDVDLDGNARRYNGGVVDMGAYEYQGERSGGGMVISVKTGDWEDPSTWDVGRVPVAGDQVVLDQNHTVSVNGTATALTIEYRQGATLQFNGTNSSLQIGL